MNQLNKQTQALIPMLDTERVLDVMSNRDKINISNDLMDFISETARIETGGEKNPLTAKNPFSGAAGKFQFIEKQYHPLEPESLNDSFTTGLNRLSAEKLDAKGQPIKGDYVYYDKLPKWIIDAQQHKDITKLSEDQQTAVFLANLHQQKGTNKLFKKISKGDGGAKVDMYEKYHYKSPLPNNIVQRVNDIFFGLI